VIKEIAMQQRLSYFISTSCKKRSRKKKTKLCFHMLSVAECHVS